jgi:hypothetical protein
LKKSTLSGTWTGDLPVCSIVPQPTTLPPAPHNITKLNKYSLLLCGKLYMCMEGFINYVLSRSYHSFISTLVTKQLVQPPTEYRRINLLLWLKNTSTLVKQVGRRLTFINNILLRRKIEINEAASIYL